MNKLENKFVIVTAFHNAEPYIYQNLRQSQKQSFDDLGILFIDDASTDGTKECVFNEMENIVEIESGKTWKGVFKDRKIIYHKNSERNSCPALNQKAAIDKYISNTGTICGIVDGDDFLIDTKAVEHVYNTMENGNYFMYSSSPVLIDGSDKVKGTRISIPFKNPYVIGNPPIRQQGWHFHHFRAFKKILSDNVDTGRSFYNPGGDFMDTASDVTYFRPMFEMAGWHNIIVEPDKRFYGYRSELSTNDHVNVPIAQNRNTIFSSNAYSGLHFINGEQEAQDFMEEYKLHSSYLESPIYFSGISNGKSGYHIWYPSCWHPDGITGCSTPYDLLTGLYRPTITP